MGKGKVLMDVVMLDSEQKATLEELFGEAAHSWDEVKTWDDVVTPDKRFIISSVEKEKQKEPICPYLGKKDSYFRFCEARAKQLADLHIGYELTEKLTPTSAQYHANIGHYALQIWCLDGENSCNCIFFPKDQRVEQREERKP